MRRGTWSVLGLVVALCVVGGCSRVERESMMNPIQGSGKMVELKQDAVDFTRIVLTDGVQATISQGKEYRVVIKADDSIADYVGARQWRDTVTIGLTKRIRYSNAPIQANIVLPDLDFVYLKGSSEATVKGFSFGHDVLFRCWHRTRLTADVEARNVMCRMSGASKMKLTGSATKLEANIRSSATLDASGFTCQNAFVDMSGVGEATISPTGKLSAKLSGAADLQYYGDPTLDEIYTAGTSKVRRVE